MWELPTFKTNFLFENSQDFNQTTHAAPHLPVVFIDNIILYFNYLVFVLHVFKRSHNAHIMLFLVTSQCMLIKPWKYFCKKNTSIFLSRKHTISRMNWLDLLSTAACLQLSKVAHVQNNWVLLIFAFCMLWLNALQKVSLQTLWNLVLLGFSKWQQIQNIANCNYLFMLKTDTMLHCWLPYKEKCA